jgi:hypothetical protein
LTQLHLPSLYSPLQSFKTTTTTKGDSWENFDINFLFSWDEEKSFFFQKKTRRDNHQNVKKIVDNNNNQTVINSHCLYGKWKYENISDQTSVTLCRFFLGKIVVTIPRFQFQNASWNKINNNFLFSFIGNLIFFAFIISSNFPQFFYVCWPPTDPHAQCQVEARNHNREKYSGKNDVEKCERIIIIHCVDQSKVTLIMETCRLTLWRIFLGKKLKVFDWNYLKHFKNFK